jgi:hypothetical protein
LVLALTAQELQVLQTQFEGYVPNSHHQRMVSVVHQSFAMQMTDPPSAYAYHKKRYCKYVNNRILSAIVKKNQWKKEAFEDTPT